LPGLQERRLQSQLRFSLCSYSFLHLCLLSRAFGAEFYSLQVWKRTFYTTISLPILISPQKQSIFLVIPRKRGICGTRGTYPSVACFPGFFPTTGAISTRRLDGGKQWMMRAVWNKRVRCVRKGTRRDVAMVVTLVCCFGDGDDARGCGDSRPAQIGLLFQGGGVSAPFPIRAKLHLIGPGRRIESLPSFQTCFPCNAPVHRFPNLQSALQ
jgi:hypothetical protein